MRDSMPCILANSKGMNMIKLPYHDAALYLQHNEHKNMYEEASQWIADNDMYDWENEEAKQRAIETDSIWTIQWYPNTPVGFNAVAAPTLEELLQFAMKYGAEDSRPADE
jgi:hypothetical protein